MRCLVTGMQWRPGEVTLAQSVDFSWMEMEHDSVKGRQASLKGRWVLGQQAEQVKHSSLSEGEQQGTALKCWALCWEEQGTAVKCWALHWHWREQFSWACGSQISCRERERIAAKGERV